MPIVAPPSTWRFSCAGLTTMPGSTATVYFSTTIAPVLGVTAISQTSSCVRRGRRSCITRLPVWVSMLTSVAFGRGHILLVGRRTESSRPLEVHKQVLSVSGLVGRNQSTNPVDEIYLVDGLARTVPAERARILAMELKSFGVQSERSIYDGNCFNCIIQNSSVPFGRREIANHIHTNGLLVPRWTVDAWFGQRIEDPYSFVIHKQVRSARPSLYCIEPRKILQSLRLRNFVPSIQITLISTMQNYKLRLPGGKIKSGDVALKLFWCKARPDD